MHILIANFGNDSIALIQWAFEQKLKDVTVLYVETGWAAPEWPARVEKCVQWAQSLGMHFVSLKPKQNFTELMHARGEFPTRKFQWCASTLKGVTINQWLDEFDFEGRATVLLAHRRSSSIVRAKMPEKVDSSEHYGNRTVWHPLFEHSPEQRDNLIKKAGFKVLTHRSLECDPCVNSDMNDVLRLSDSVVERTAALEQALDQQLLDPTIYHGVKDLSQVARNSYTTPRKCLEIFDMGCGSPYGCGM